MIKSGQWKQGNVKTAEVAKLVSKEVSVQWGKTDIPTLFTSNNRKAEKEIVKVIDKGKYLLKTQWNEETACLEQSLTLY